MSVQCGVECAKVLGICGAVRRDGVFVLHVECSTQ